MKRLLGIFALAVALPVAALAQSYSAVLSGANEVPGPGDTDGSGFAVVTIEGTTIRYSVLTQNIAVATAAHIHVGASGVAGDVVVPLNAATLTNGTTTASQTIIDQIKANPAGFYVNVHTADFPGGAVRGQLAGAQSPEGTRTAYLPIVGKVVGANNTNFVTDLRIVNQTGTSATVTLDFFAASAQGQTAPTVTKTVTVAAGEQKVLNDLLAGTLQTTGLGGLRLTSTQPVVVTARVVNDLRANGLGTTGFSVSSSSLEDAETAGTLSFLSQASSSDVSGGVGFRTNIGWFNPNATPVTTTFTARRTSNGASLGSNTVTVPGYSQLQQGIFQLLTAVGAADQIQSDFYVTWTSSAPLFVYGSVVDNKTGDSVFIE